MHHLRVVSVLILFLLYLRSSKGGCCSISDDLSCSLYHFSDVDVHITSRCSDRKGHKHTSCIINKRTGYTVTIVTRCVCETRMPPAATKSKSASLTF